MDGNGRWAKKRGLSRSEGHKAGAESARKVITACRKQDIPYLTLYAFSTENWSRPKEEVKVLFDLLVYFLRREEETLLENDIRLHVLGEIQDLPSMARQVVNKACQDTAANRSMTLNLALNYSGRQEILRACQKLYQQGLPPSGITATDLADHLYTAGQPDPDLLIRTSGEKRLSNYLLFQCAYTEFYFSDTLWPDFDEPHLGAALREYRQRQRRFGRID
jgi:undecaprenyl diphosphate synthase